MSSKTTSGKAARSFINKVNEDPILRNLSIVSFKEAEAVAACDAPNVSSDVRMYVKANAFTYYLIINLWLFLIKEVTERGCLELHEAIVKKGLLQVIAESNTLANDMIADYCDQLIDHDPVPGYMTNLVTSARNDREALQLLRFPKRFSPDGADLIEATSVAGLIEINGRCRDINRGGFLPHASYSWKRYPDGAERRTFTPSRYWIDRIRDRICDMLRGYKYQVTDGFFSTGVAADTSRPLGAKLQGYAAWDPKLFDDVIYPIGFRYKAVDQSFRSMAYCAEVKAVPKSFKAARIIAEEHAYRQFHMQAIRIAVERCLTANGYTDYLDLHSQIRNQQYANLGSRNGCYATIDLSSASDSVARTLAYEVLPSSLVRDVDKYLPRTFRVGRTQRTMHMFCTSGSAVTFPVESILFLGIALEVRETVTALTGEFYLPPCVFGDDIVVDTMLYDTMVDVLTVLGFTVNSEKSFGAHTNYRESCGCEYVCGYDLQANYWPRATFRWTGEGYVNSTASLCSLEHKLYENYLCKVFLTRVVRSLEPRMTSHAVGTECVDLWESIPQYKVTRAPGLKSCTDSGAERRLHLVLKTKHPIDLSDHALPGEFSRRALVEMWRYSRFLMHGRQYDDELLRTLGVSSKPTPISDDTSDGEQYWGYAVD